MHAEYLLLLALCLLVTLPLEFIFTARVYRRPRALLWALVPVIIIYSIWDLIGIARGNWSYVESRISGLVLPGHMPIEELLFFAVIPLCGLLTFESVRRVLAAISDRRRASGAKQRGGGPDA